MIDIGVANPKAQGHAMISTATAFNSPCANRDPGPRLDLKTKRGWSVSDMANGPYLRSSFPVSHPDTVALPRKLGSPASIKVQDDEILGVIKRKQQREAEDIGVHP